MKASSNINTNNNNNNGSDDDNGDGDDDDDDINLILLTNSNITISFCKYKRILFISKAVGIKVVEATYYLLITSWFEIIFNGTLTNTWKAWESECSTSW